MATLTPAPSSLGLASPALGPWFRDGTAATPNLDAAGADLSVAVSLPHNMEWRAPAGCTVSYAVATTSRPRVLASLRKPNDAPAFTESALVILATLLPEVELRLAALSNALPSPDNNAPAAGTPSRATPRHLALEVTATAMSDVELLRESSFPGDVDTEEKQAEYLGLTVNGAALGNAPAPVRELHRPAKPSAVICKNRTGADVAATLWAFDDRGRAIDPGAVAAWWAHLGTAAVFDNLWAHDDAADQRTADFADARTVLFCSAHESNLPATHRSRLSVTDLTQVLGSSAAGVAMYTIGAAPAVTLTAAPTPDLLPIPRLALLPHRPYAAPAAPGTALFAGWTGAAWPVTLSRDFVRVALMDIESHLVGLDRTDDAQADAARRVTAMRNTAAAPFLATTDAATTQLLNALTAGAPAHAMSPVMDARWGAVTAPPLGTDPLPDTLDFAVQALRGEGAAAGGTVSGQRVVVRFGPGTLPARGWVRLWTHGLDTTTGARFRQDGGAARADAAGRAFVVLSLPDGTAAGADTTPMSFDALLSTDLDARIYVEQRFDRPALVAGAPETLPPPPGTLAAGLTAWICEQGAPLVRSGAALASGETLLAVPDDETGGVYALVDPSSVVNADLAPLTLRVAVGVGDRLAVTAPAFGDTPEGDVVAAAGPIGDQGATVLHRGRSGVLDSITTLGRPVPTMERREVAAVDSAGTVGVVAATPGRAASHEAIPSQLAHPGVPASAEIHGAGVALNGPAAAPLATIMRERVSGDLGDYVEQAQLPVTPAADPGGTSTFAALLETLTHGVAGDSAVRAFLATQELLGTEFLPGQSWTSLKDGIESASGVDLDARIDSATFNNVALAAAVDQLILKTRDGAMQGATAMLAAIDRAEDFVYIETPAIDTLTADGGAIDLMARLLTRIADRPGLVVMLCVGARFLPNQPRRLEQIRKAGVQAALQRLIDNAPDNVVLFTPTAGSARDLYMSATTVIVDDAVLFSGTAHLWRRGLTFDSSLTVALVDEAVTRGRPAAVRAARRQLLGDRLGIAPALVPDDAEQMRHSVQRLNAVGGLQRVNPAAYAAAANTIPAGELEAWVPDGRPGGTSDWYLFFAGLDAAIASEVNNAVR